MSITYTATLPVRDRTVLYLSKLLHAERQRRGTRNKLRAPVELASRISGRGS